ncbi:hypothetical protein Y032_0005g2254 [Ancylostoma ceylanicum]|uniref:guanylate cyclase n=2 Tax=Ancylostoma ceylanicum TaxID=53326 RepID=A0A016VQR7_9BILA|nr:hypothetical protein Y032_0005g2254 [Ancylostoma ceylanicum]
MSSSSLNSGYSAMTDRLCTPTPRSDLYELYLYQGENIIARKHLTIPLLTKNIRSHLRKMCEIDHDNVNRFIGMSTDGPSCLSLWRCCMRGSLKDVIHKRSVTMDGFFMFCLIKDIACGLHYIHNSFLVKHGHLTSSCCLVDERWQVKITDYGLEFMPREEPKLEHKLYTAPELLRDPQLDGTREGDVYSFAIICSELIGGTSAWNLENRKEDAEDILYMVKKGGRKMMRPELNPDSSLEIRSDLLHLIRDCWEEEPAMRPTIDSVRGVLKATTGKRNANLMDHVFKIMENYASSLEQEVEARTKELVDEKKKSDILLCRMLPKYVVYDDIE